MNFPLIRILSKLALFCFATNIALITSFSHLGTIGFLDAGVIAYSARCQESNTSQIYVIDVSNRISVSLTTNGNYVLIGWSPDGTRIAFFDEQTRDVYIMDQTGRHWRPVIIGNTHSTVFWRSENELIYWRYTLSGEYVGLFSIDVNTLNEQLLSTDPQPSMYGLDLWTDRADDGREVINWIYEGGGDDELHIRYPSTGVDERLTVNTCFDNFPRWQPHNDP